MGFARATAYRATSTSLLQPMVNWETRSVMRRGLMARSWKKINGTYSTEDTIRLNPNYLWCCQYSTRQLLDRAIIRVCQQDTVGSCALAFKGYSSCQRGYLRAQTCQNCMIVTRNSPVWSWAWPREHERKREWEREGGREWKRKYFLNRFPQAFYLRGGCDTKSFLKRR